MTPIIILLSILIFEIKNFLIKKIIISVIIIINLGNLFFEATFQQFFKERPFFKPNFTKMIEILKKDEVKFYTINLSSEKHINKYYYVAIENYISNFQIYENSDIKYLDKQKFLNSDNNKIWVLCLISIVKDKCNNIKLAPNNKILIEKKIPGMRMTLISKK